MITLRSSLEGIEPYRPGKPAELVRRLHGLARVVKLASNENPYPPLPSVQAAIARSAAEVNRYPDDECTDLRLALTTRHGVGMDQVAVGCGSIDVCFQAILATTDPGGEVLMAWPSFDAYPLLARLAGATVRRVPLRDARHDLGAMAAQVTDRTRLIILCNPNNPTGTAVGGQELDAFLREVPDTILVVIDEAYHEFVEDPTFPEGVATALGHDNVLVLRSFSKAYGLAGLRVGYGIARPEVIAALRMVHVPFAASRLAQVAALASLQAEAELQDRVRTITAERARMAGELAGLGYEIRPSEANFLLVPSPRWSDGLAAECEARGVVVRPIGPDAVRVTIGMPEENDRFLEVLQEVMRVVDRAPADTS